MMKKIVLLACILALWMVGYTENKDNIIKIACVGNSITFGHGIKNRTYDSYPAVLGRLLGEDYEVRNFGISGRTLLNKGDRPYMKEKIYQQALHFQPDIVLIKLGTNDSKPQNWKYKADFIPDLTALVKSFQNLAAQPEIYLCYPAKAYGTHWNINDSVIVHDIIPMIKKVAKAQKTKIIDLHTATTGMPENFPDQIHPNEKGAALLAEKVYRVIIKKRR